MSDPNSQKVPDDIAKMSFEEALRELEQIVEKLDSGQVDLDQSIDIYTRGSLLKAHCEARLRNAQERVDKIVGRNGNLSVEPANID
ncbi:MAG: exodeoxyribonuclease VII small subunit [Sneathiella sp.]|jgi:exodeoxyribonuclease VII small subunit|uniref:exodeoxyribonuclease VII small subunit n=1 Tax=Sneathiella sp. TaxID=1964365 RepID=UPI000C38F00D|nr:exodeoxyribonuclease VII small subunit [Sneathiella sp.]MAL78113.1 exodeoxyribonuclease VII small subunit [Sneathiella sp.]|tara:strand:- start:328 stop:585 length:258 start_codon:yes stop_codon:yes gene_type:complete